MIGVSLVERLNLMRGTLLITEDGDEIAVEEIIAALTPRAASDYAELEKRLRALAESTDAKAILCVRWNEPTGLPDWTPFGATESLADKLTEAADAIAALTRELEEARGYLTRNVLEPHGASPLPTLIGICTQVDHISATAPISTRLRLDLFAALEVESGGSAGSNWNSGWDACRAEIKERVQALLSTED